MVAQTNRHLIANRPYIIVTYKVKQIDITILCDENMSIKETKKKREYKDLEIDIKRIWKISGSNTHSDRSTWHHQKKNGVRKGASQMLIFIRCKRNIYYGLQGSFVKPITFEV